MAEPITPQRKNSSRRPVSAKCATRRPIRVEIVLAAGLRSPPRISSKAPFAPSKAMWVGVWARPCGSSNIATTVAPASPKFVMFSPFVWWYA